MLQNIKKFNDIVIDVGGYILVNDTLENERVSSFWELQAYVQILNFI